MVGYFPAFRGLEAGLVRTRIEHYTHINIAFANPDPAGLLARDGVMTCMGGGANGNVTLAELRDAVTRLKVKGAKVLLSTAGGSVPPCSGDWAALLRPGLRDTVKAGLLGLVDAAGLDGIDIDIEGELLTRIDQEGNYTPFITDLSAALHARGKLLTVATGSYEGGMIPAASIPWFDLVMPMSYDQVGPSWGEPGTEHSTRAHAEADIALWLARGVAPERLALGLPFYGRGFGAEAAGYHDFRTLLASHPETALTGDVIGKACPGCDYITFNSLATIEYKTELARTRAGGVMVWEITQDSDDQLLARTIFAVLQNSDN